MPRDQYFNVRNNLKHNISLTYLNIQSGKPKQFHRFGLKPDRFD